MAKTNRKRTRAAAAAVPAEERRQAQRRELPRAIAAAPTVQQLARQLASARRRTDAALVTLTGILPAAVLADQ